MIEEPTKSNSGRPHVNDSDTERKEQGFHKGGNSYESEVKEKPKQGSGGLKDLKKKKKSHIMLKRVCSLRDRSCDYKKVRAHESKKSTYKGGKTRTSSKLRKKKGSFIGSLLRKIGPSTFAKKERVCQNSILQETERKTWQAARAKATNTSRKEVIPKTEKGRKKCLQTK